jgi:site-specific recombinase XerD
MAPMSATVALLDETGRVVSAGLLLRWKHGREIRTGLCAIAEQLTEVRKLRLGVKGVDESTEWVIVPLRGLALGEPIAAGRVLAVLRLDGRRLREYGHDCVLFASETGFGTTPTPPGAAAFTALLCDDSGHLRQPRLLIQGSVAANDAGRSGCLLVNVPGAAPPCGTPVFGRSDSGAESWPLLGFVATGLHPAPGVYRVEPAWRLMETASGWQSGSDADLAVGPVDALFGAFLLDSAASGRYSKATLYARQQDVRQLSRWAARHRIPLASISAEQIKEYLAARRGSGCSVRTINREAWTLKALFNFAVESGARADDPMADIAAPTRARATRSARDALTKSEVAKIVGAADTATALGTRDRAMLMLLFEVGLKPSEVVSLTRNQLNLSAGVLAMPKGRQSARRLHISGSLRKALQAHMRTLDADADGRDAPLFRNPSGGSLTRQTVGDVVKRHAKTAGIDKPVSGSTARAYTARRLLSGGLERKRVADFLGLGRAEGVARLTGD